VRVLAFDTSSPAVVTAVVRAEALEELEREPMVYADRELAPNRHGEMLAPMIERSLGLAGVEAAELDAIGVGLGPGPFTGLRVGVVTAKTMGDALGIPTYGACSLDVIAHAHRPGGRPFVVVTDARRKQVYWRRFDAAGEPVGPPDISRPAELAERLRGEVDAVVGAGVELYPEAFTGFATVRRVGSDPVGFPDAADLARMVMARAFARAPGDDLVPMYLRRPDARPPGRPKQVTPA
jgi:tRNA threonylcarbamoyl adenosine modification protein YeaZ